MLRIDGFVPDKTLLLDLLAAVFLGVLGALAVFGFHSALHAARHLLYGQTVGLVGAARSLLWWQRFWFLRLVVVWLVWFCSGRGA